MHLLFFVEIRLVLSVEKCGPGTCDMLANTQGVRLIKTDVYSLHVTRISKYAEDTLLVTTASSEPWQNLAMIEKERWLFGVTFID